jgi:hypothetical protein
MTQKISTTAAANDDEATVTATVTDAVSEKLADALTPGYQAEFDPDEAERAGAFAEDALSEEDAMNSTDDLSEAELAARPHQQPM